MLCMNISMNSPTRYRVDADPLRVLADKKMKKKTGSLDARIVNLRHSAQECLILHLSLLVGGHSLSGNWSDEALPGSLQLGQSERSAHSLSCSFLDTMLFCSEMGMQTDHIWRGGNVDLTGSIHWQLRIMPIEHITLQYIAHTPDRRCTNLS